jgi:hypothetical protein
MEWIKPYLDSIQNNPIIKDLNSVDPLNKILVYVTIITIILSCVLSIVYLATALWYIVKVSGNPNPLNIEALDYAVIYALSFNNKGDFNYTYMFIIFLGIGLMSTVFHKNKWLFYIYNMINPKSKRSALDNPIINTLMTISLFGLLIAVVAQSLLTVLAGKSIIMVNKRATLLNTFICTRIYKKGVFLKNLETPKRNIIDTEDTIVKCLKLLEKEKDVMSLAKGFYTLTLYRYYQNLTLNNPNINGAFELFNSNSLLQNHIKQKCRPSSYMQRYGTFIEDIGESLIRPHMSKSSLVNNAMNKCDEWISSTNEFSNTLYPSEALNAFIILIIGTCVIQVILVASIGYYGLPRIKDKPII